MSPVGATPLTGKVPITKRDAAKRQTWQPRFIGFYPTITALQVNNSRGHVNYSGQEADMLTAEDVFDVVMKYYPEKSIPVKTRFFVEELLKKF